MSSKISTPMPVLADWQFERIRSSGGLTSVQVQHVLDGIKSLTSIEELDDIPDALFESVRRSGSLSSPQVSHVFDGIKEAGSKAFEYEVTLTGTVNLFAPSQAAAEHLLKRKLSRAPVLLGPHVNGAPITTTCNLVGEPQLVEVAGRPVAGPTKPTAMNQLANAALEALNALEAGDEALRSANAAVIAYLRGTLTELGLQTELTGRRIPLTVRITEPGLTFGKEGKATWDATAGKYMVVFGAPWCGWYTEEQFVQV